MPNYQISATLNAQINGFRQNMNESARVSGQTANVIDGNMQRIDRSAQRAGRSIAASAQEVRRSTPNYTELGRVLQDLPFGFIGIQNNLTQLIPSAGLAGLAFSALVSALTFAQVGTSAWTRGLGDNKKALDNTKKASEEYLQSLNQLSQAHLKGAQDAQKELVELTSLYKITQDANLSLKARQDAVNKLQQQYPDYFKNIKDESFLVGAADKAYKELTESIIATGRARAAQDLIVKNTIRQLENTNKILDLEKQLAKTSEDSSKLRQKAELEIGSQRELTLNKAIVVDTQRANMQKEINNLKTDSNILDTRNLELTKSIMQEVKNGADLADYTAPAEKLGKLFNPKLDTDGLNRKKDFVDPTYAYRQKVALQGLLDDLNNYQSGVDKFSKNLSDSQQRAIQNMLSFNTSFEQNLEALNSSTISEGITNGFLSIGEALYTGANVFESAGQAILSTVSGFLAELGSMLVKKGVATIAAGTALNFLAPGSGSKQIAGGLGLIAAGSALSLAAGFGNAAMSGGNKKRGNITAFADGGLVYGPTNALIGEYSGARNNPEVVAPLDKLKGIMKSDGNNVFQVIPIIGSKELAILVKNGNAILNRQ